MTPSAPTDVLVWGGGVAGAAAALFARRLKLNVALVDRNASPPAAPALEWTNPAVADLLKPAGIRFDDFVRGSLNRLVLYDAATLKSIKTAPPPRSALAIVDSAALAAAMLDAARSAGAGLVTGAEVQSSRSGENAVTLRLANGESLNGRLLIAADGADSLAARLLGLPPTSRRAQPMCCCQWTSPETPAAPDGPASGQLNLILGTQTAHGFGYAYAAAGRVVVGLVEPGTPDRLRDRLAELATRWSTEGLLHDARPDPAAAVTRLVPRGAALDMEAHVAKGAAFIGDAGGFVASLHHEGVYPAVWSARFAVDVLVAALGSTRPQDTLIQFDSAWRTAMTDYLRLPNADLQFLLPLIFNNAVLAGKFARAFVTGDNL